MSINIRPFRSGGWEVDIVITYPNGEKFRERRKAPMDSKLSARRWAQERERHLLQHGRPPRRGEKINPTQEAPPVPTLAEFVPRYLEHIKANRQKPSTQHTKHLICRNHLIPQFFGDGSTRSTSTPSSDSRCRWPTTRPRRSTTS